MSNKSILGESNSRRRLSIPEVKTAFKDITGSPRKFKNPLGSPRRCKSPRLDNEYCDLNDAGPIISKSRLTMDRVHTPEPTCEDQPDGAFLDLRPSSPYYIKKFQRYGSNGDSQVTSDDDEDEDIHTEKSTKSQRMNMDFKSSVDEQQFQVVQTKSYSKRRYLIKVPIENRIVERCEDVHILEDTASPRYPTCMQSYKRGVSPTPGEMDLGQPEEASLSSLRAKTKLRISNMYRKNIEILQLRFAATEMEPELEKMENEMNNTKDVDLLHIMDNDGKIMWKDIDDSDTEAALDTDIDSIPTLDHNKFKDLDPEDILDAYLTEKYIVLESDQPLIQF